MSGPRLAAISTHWWPRRIKVAAHLVDWFDEFRGYHRDKGLIVKVNDDLMSATRIAVMAHRKAQTAQPTNNGFYGGVRRDRRPINSGGIPLPGFGKLSFR